MSRNIVAAEKDQPTAQELSYAWLKRRIVSTPREEAIFLTEVDIAAAAGTSRTPVREALLKLESEGYIRRVPRKGVYIPPISDAEVEWVMEARRIVEGWCVQRLAELGDSSIRLDLVNLLNKQQELADDHVAFIDCDREFHTRIVSHAKNPILSTFYESLRDKQLRMGVVALGSSNQRVGQVIQEHALIVDAIREGDPQRAIEMVTEHLDRTLVAMVRR